MNARNDWTSMVCSFPLVACVLAVVGYFGPWISHETAALTVTGYELSEFAKFFPEVQGGAVPVTRALFITPLLAAGVSIGLLLNRSNARLPIRLVAIALVALPNLLVVPPYDYVFEPQYRFQLTLVALSLLLTLLTTATHQLSSRARGVLLAILSLAGIIPALWQLALLRPLVLDLYQAPIEPGWGLIACIVGLILLLLFGVRTAIGVDPFLARILPEE